MNISLNIDRFIEAWDPKTDTYTYAIVVELPNGEQHMLETPPEFREALFASLNHPVVEPDLEPVWEAEDDWQQGPRDGDEEDEEDDDEAIFVAAPHIPVPEAVREATLRVDTVFGGDIVPKAKKRPQPQPSPTQIRKAQIRQTLGGRLDRKDKKAELRARAQKVHQAKIGADEAGNPIVPVAHKRKHVPTSEPDVVHHKPTVAVAEDDDGIPQG